MILVFVFQTLIYSGFLNKFETNIQITNKTNNKLSIKNAIKSNYLKNKNDWDNSYYYISNEKYGNMNNIRTDLSIFNPNNKYKNLNYFDVIFNEQNWITFYAMDWISQISFFNHYIFHQVLYVTGATGQGKSTQVPKLLLYASKMIDYKNNSKIICTQPRVSPTIGNSTRIAEELGYPIEHSSNNVSYKIRTDNYYVQYKYQKDSHMSNIQSFLRIVTDGTLYEEMKKNILLLKKYNNDKYYNENIYDILIVDEAHEHNTNMDLILALAKQTCYNNNKIKLIIVSATMDDDEPIYRRYYKNINDNLAFPIKHSFIHPILGYDFFINTEYLDRRYHISPPGQTTQYKIIEKYLDSDTSKPLNIQAKEAQHNAIITALKICSTSTEGNILIFGTGEADIYDSIEKLNNQLPPDIIALPYLSNMNDDYKTIIAKIDKKISNIRNKKSNIHLEWKDKYIEDITVPYDLYKRAIIIATNVAEASITIPKLKYVIDNGFAKVNKYNKKIFASVLDIEEISESSRLQRKGRVGRIDNGDVYYMYAKNSREFIKPKYQITQDSIAMKIIELASSKTIQDIKLIEENRDLDKILLLTNKLITYNIDPNLVSFYQHKNLSKDSYFTNDNFDP
jgi:HrpA-like RNA helicase